MQPARPQANTAPPVTVAQIREAIGSLFMLWASTEQEIRQCLAAFGFTDEDLCISHAITRWKSLHTARAGIPAQIDVANRFVARLTAARLLRNGIGHGFAGFSADPLGQGLPVELQYRQGRETVTVPFRQLERSIADLATAGFTLYRLTAAATDPSPLGTEDIVADIAQSLDRTARDHPDTV